MTRYAPGERLLSGGASGWCRPKGEIRMIDLDAQNRTVETSGICLLAPTFPTL